jgi:FlaA1/EpsC-like NDP-sugar epimerase
MNHDKKSGYARFAAMIVTSTVVMYGLMYLNMYELSHVRWSETRVYMALIMGAVMAVIMLSFMRGMFSDKKINLAIYLGSVVVFAGALFLVRSQTTVQDSSYMRAMIPHHSIAILASERADIRDMRVRQLADEIIEAQRREIMEMDWLLEDIREHGIASTEAEAEARPIPDFEVEP